MSVTDQEIMPLKSEDKEADPIAEAKLDGARIATNSVIEEVGQLAMALTAAEGLESRNIPFPSGMRTVKETSAAIVEVVRRHQEALSNHTLGFGNQSGHPDEPLLNTHPLSDNFIGKTTRGAVFKEAERLPEKAA